MPVSERGTLENFEKGTLTDEANDGMIKRRLFRPNIIEQKVEEVFLPILIIPGVASSGLVVEKSSMDEKYEGLRLWMNAAFLAKSRLTSKVLNSEELKDNKDEGNSDTFAKAEEEVEITNLWIHHIALDSNMMDEKKGNRVRPYEGLSGCEYLVDSIIEKGMGYVWAPMVNYCVNTMGYERGKNVDAMPYDWRLAPSLNEKRDGYLTKMIARIERMYEENDDLPIVLACHSMGAKMGHYFLNFAKKQKGQEWIDKYIHTYMPIGGPAGGVGCAVRTGITGQGLDDTVDALVGNVGDGLQMYRTWSCGNWLMPRMLPKGVFPTCIVRREGELGVTLTSDIEVGHLFSNREKPPKELRLVVVFRDDIHAYSDYCPVVQNENGNNPQSMTVYFNETFYIAVPYLDKKVDVGELVFFLEEPAGIVNQNRSKFGKKFSEATSQVRSLKKNFSAFARNFAKTVGSGTRVATCDRPLVLRVSDFDTNNGKNMVDKKIPIIAYNGTKTTMNHSDAIKDESIGIISLKLSYSPPPESTGTKVSKTPIAMINDETPNPSIMRNRLNSLFSSENVVYDVMNGTDVFKADGFVENMFNLVEKVYEGDPLGPTKESALDAPPVNCVRSIYGINIPTEAGGIYQKVPVVTVGDNKADCRYMLDKSANLRPNTAQLNLMTYKIKNGIVYETDKTLQDVPGKTEQVRACGDGTVPYWSMIHVLNWKDRVDDLTVDELPGAGHRAVIADERFFALLKRYCKVIDPRANAMMMMKEQLNDATSAGISSLGLVSDNF